MDVINFARVRRFNEWGTPEKLVKMWLALYECILDVLQRVNSHAAHMVAGEKSFVHVQNFFCMLACENESGRVRTFAKCVQRL